MRILITGGAGFVGRNLACYLNNAGHQVTVFDNLVRRGAELNVQTFKEEGIAFRHGDVRNREDWPQFGVDVVLECAAQPSAIDGYQNPMFDVTNNTFGALNALEYCRQHDAGLIFWSTNKVYPLSALSDYRFEELATRWTVANEWYDGLGFCEGLSLDGADRSIYGASKVAADLLIQEWADAFQIPAVINRFSCLAGPWQWGKCEQGWVAWWIIAHRLGLPLQYIGFKGKQVRDVLDVRDLCRLIELQIESLRPGPEVFNVGGGKANTLSLMECTLLAEKITGNTVDIETIEEPRRADFRVYISDITKVCHRYGWAPSYSPTKTLENIDRWAVDNLKLLQTLYGGSPQVAPFINSYADPEIVGV